MGGENFYAKKQQKCWFFCCDFFTRHALERMKERSISKKLIDSAFAKPTKILYDYDDRILIKKLYKRRRMDRLLIIAGKLEKGDFKIITVIETSKTNKYL